MILKIRSERCKFELLRSKGSIQRNKCKNSAIIFFIIFYPLKSYKFISDFVNKAAVSTSP